MEYGYIMLLMTERFQCSVYMIFISTMYTKNSLLEIIYIILSIFNIQTGRSGGDIQFSVIFQQLLMFSKVT